MLAPTFIAVSDKSSRSTNHEVKPRGKQKVESFGKENRPSASSKIPTWKKPSNSIQIEKKSSSTIPKSLKTQKSFENRDSTAKTKSVPDFDKIHQKWTEKFEKLKEETKKEPTKIIAFNLSQGARKNCAARTDNTLKEIEEFQIDQSAYKSIFDGELYMDPGKEERKTIAVPNRSRMILKEVQQNRSSFHAGPPRDYARPEETKNNQTPKRGSFYTKTSAKPDFKETDRDRKLVAVKQNDIEVAKEKAVKTNSVASQDFKVDFKPDPNALKLILQESGVDKTPLRGSSTFGPMKRMTFNGISRKKPYNVINKQERKGSIYHNENCEKLKSLTFEQRLSVIINSRPGLNGSRRQSCINFQNDSSRNSFYCSKKAQGERRVPGDSVDQMLNQDVRIQAKNDVLKTDSNKSSNITIPSGRPKPKLFGKLCEINYISPRKTVDTTTSNENGSIANATSLFYKSPSRHSTLKEMISKLTPKKLASLRQGPGRLTEEARYNLQHGLPLPPKERRYEYADLNKGTKLTPKRSTATKKRDKSESSAKHKKAVRWADVLEGRKSQATKQLNFDDEVKTCNSSLKEQNLSAPKQVGENPQEENLISKIFRNIQNIPSTAAENGAIQKRSTPETILTQSNTEPKVCHTPVLTSTKAIPKPFNKASFRLQVEGSKSLLQDGNAWNIESPATGLDLGISQLNQAETPQIGNNLLAESRLSEATRSKKSTPLAGLNFDSSLVNCPAIRRTWARTPHAKEEEERKKKANLSLDNTIQHMSTLSTTVTEFDGPGHESEQDSHLSDVDWKSYFDVSKGCLEIIDDINKFFILEDMKKVCSYRENATGSRAAFVNSSSNQEKPSVSDYYIQNAKQNDLIKSGFKTNYSVDPNFYSRSYMPVPFTRIGHNSKNSISENDQHSLNSYLTALPQPRDSNNCKDIFKSSQRLPNFHNSNIIYSTAPIRDSGSLKDISAAPRTVKQSGEIRIVEEKQNTVEVKASKSITQNVPVSILSSATYCQQEMKPPIHIDKVNSKTDHAMHINSKISAIVEDYLRPVRSLIDSAFSFQSSLTQNLHASHLQENLDNCASNPRMPHHSSEAHTLVRSRDFPNGEERFNMQNVHLSNGSAFRKVSTGTNASVVEHRCLHDGKDAIFIPNGKRNEYSNIRLLDAEVAFHTKFLEVTERLGSRKIERRNCHDPVAKILSLGDAYHFIPIEEE